MNKAVVLGSNYYIGLSIIRCLGKNNIEVIAMDYNKSKTYGSKSKYLSEQIIVPHYNDEQSLLTCLIDYGKEQAVKPVLLPSADAYVAFMDKHLDVLKAYYLIPMTDQGLWTKLMDKDELRHLCDTYHVAIPETIDSNDINWTDFNEKIGYPCLLKPADSPPFVSYYRKKMFICHNQNELEAKIKQTKSDGFKMIIQRKIIGPDSNVCTYDVYLNQESKVTHSMTCQKIRQFPINYGASSYTVQRHIAEIQEIGSKFLEDVGYKGFAEIEFKKDDRNNQYYLIEVNTRTTTLNVLLDKIGINFPLVLYNELVLNKGELCIYEESSEMAFRYHIEDLISVKNYIRTNQLTIKDYLNSLHHKIVYAIWSLDDPKPYISYIVNMILRK